MSIKDEMIDILINNREKEAILFLKRLSSEDKKILAPTLKKIARNLNRYYNEFHFNPDMKLLDEITKELILHKKSQLILNKFAFVCLSYEEMRRAVEFISLDEVEEDILPWYRPSWLNRYFLEMVDFEIDYKKMLLFMSRGWLSPTKEFIALNAAYGLFDGEDKLEENIWYLFEYYTTIANNESWVERFKELCQSGKIDRMRVLKESLLTANRGFNKPFSGYFCKIFNGLEPSDEELLILQEELILSLLV